MQVFKTFFKVIKRNLGQLSIYLFVFLGISVLISNIQTPLSAGEFTVSECPIAVISRDGDTPLVKGLRDYLVRDNRPVELTDDTESIQDALFFHNVEYVVIVPEGFTDGFLRGEDVKLQAMAIPGSTNAYYLDMLTERYCNTARLYRSSMPELTQEQVVGLVTEDLQVTAQVEYQQVQNRDDAWGTYLFYFRYLPYAMLGMMILGIGSIMMAFQKTDLRRRNLCSPLSLRGMNLQLVMGGGIFALVCWGALILFSLLLYGETMLNSGVMGLMLLNSLSFTVFSTALAFLVGLFVRNYNVMSALANVLSLGLCFLSGVFVPQELLGEGVLKIASFTPTYWYVKAIEAIGTLSTQSWEQVSPILLNMLIQLGFAVALFAVALLASKQRRTSNG